MSKVHRHRVLLAVVLASFAGGAALLYAALFAGLPDPSAPLSHAGRPSILINDRYGRTLYEVIDPQGSKYLPLPLTAMPLACRQATIATEDSRFYAHPGVDPIAIVRAAWQNLRGQQTVSGGSTLTQQVARNLYLSADERTERSLRRKLREAWLAWRIERRYSKDEILALYLNTTYYGHFAVGLEAAAQAYFGQHARELDLAQCALLAGIPQFPAGYNPVENLEAAHARQGVVLNLMQRSGYISAEQAAGAAGERMAFASTPFPIEAPHFVMWVQSRLETLLPSGQLQALSLATTDQNGGRGGGLKVTTTLDLDWQRQAEAIVARRLAQLRPCSAGASAGCDPQASPARRVDDAALVALDPQTGAVLAMVGSADYFDPRISGAVNAALSLRQPGSAIKPLTYAAAFDPEQARAAGRAPWTPATLIADVRTVFPTSEGQPYVPQNYDLQYHGPVLARSALANSYNIPAVKALQEIGVDALIDQASRLGINWLGAARASDGAAAPEATGALRSPKSFGLALTLGGGEVRLLDLTAAYAALANGGRRITPYGISQVETMDGTVLLDGEPAQPGPRALDPRVAFLVTSILSDAEARLPAFGQNSVLEIGRPAAAKTGTTTDWRDNWTLGYTPDLVTGVWAGNADNSAMYDVSGVSGAGPIWHDFMAAALRGTSPRAFPRPDGLVQVEVCADSGLPALEQLSAAPTRAQRQGDLTTVGHYPAALAPSAVPCPNRRREWFIAGTEPEQEDRMHWRVAMDAQTGQPATAGASPAALRYETYWIMPAELQAWGRANNVLQPLAGPGQDDEVAPSLTSGAVAGSGRGPAAAVPALALLSPDTQRAYRLDPGLPADAQRLPVTAEPGPALARAASPITLLVDGKPLATVIGPDYTAWWPLAPGRHSLQAVAADGSGVQSSVVTITVQ